MSARSLALLSALALISLAPAAQAAEDKALKAAIAGAARTEPNTARDPGLLGGEAQADDHRNLTGRRLLD